jgi:hypothetical protein
LDNLDLPKFEEGKKLTCPGNTLIRDVIKFISDKVGFEKFIICRAGHYNPLDYVELVMPIKVTTNKVNINGAI